MSALIPLTEPGSYEAAPKRRNAVARLLGVLVDCTPAMASASAPIRSSRGEKPILIVSSRLADS
jgi:hypothetical protein